MDFNFHKGDYVEVSDGTKGYVIEVTNGTSICLRWKITERGVSFKAPNVGSIIEVHKHELTIGNNKYNRIGEYCFQRYPEIDKLTDKDKEVHFTLSTGDTCNINQYIGNGEYESVIYSSNVIDKINELIGVVNKLSKRLDGLTNK